MRIISIDKRLSLIGQNLKFKQENFFDLIPGTIVTQIGDGRNTGTYRTDTFKNPVIYMGSIVYQFDEKETLYAFQLKPKHKNNNLYLLYGSTGDEIFTEELTNNQNKNSYMRYYTPQFKILN